MNEPIASLVVPSQTRLDAPVALQEPTRSKNLLFMVLYTVASMVMGAGNITIGTLLLAEHIATFVSGDQQTSIFSLILGVGAVLAVLTNPIVGMLSDRTSSRWGRRRPWYIVGGVLTVLDLLFMGYVPSLLAVAIGYIVLQITINMYQVALSAIVPDQVPIHQRATLSALSVGLGSLLGALFGQTLVAQFFKTIPAAYTSLAVSVAIMMVLFLLVLRDDPLPREHIPALQVKQIFAMFKPLASRDFALVWVSRCLMFLGYVTTNAFMFYFLQNAIHYEKLFPGQTNAQGVRALFAVNVVAIILASLVGGIISDKLLRRKVFVILASLVMAVGLSLYAFFPIWAVLQIGIALVGGGFGIYLAVDFALVTQVLPVASDRGKDVGIMQMAPFVPQVVAPVVAGLTLGLLHSYLALFMLLAIGAFIAAALIVPIKSVR